MDDDNAKSRDRVETLRAVFGGSLSELTDVRGRSRVRKDSVMISTIRYWGRKGLASAMVGGGGTNVVCRVEAGLLFPS